MDFLYCPICGEKELEVYYKREPLISVIAAPPEPPPLNKDKEIHNCRSCKYHSSCNA